MTVAAFEGVAQTAGSKAQPASSFFVILERTLVGSPAVSSCGVQRARRYRRFTRTHVLVFV